MCRVEVSHLLGAWQFSLPGNRVNPLFKKCSSQDVVFPLFTPQKLKMKTTCPIMHFFLHFEHMTFGTTATHSNNNTVASLCSVLASSGTFSWVCCALSELSK